MFTCANFGFRVTSYIMPNRLDAKALFAFVETEDEPVNEITCEIFQSTTLNFYDKINPLVTNRIGFCRNINQLPLNFSRPVALAELLYLPKLQKLEKLCLYLLLIK